MHCSFIYANRKIFSSYFKFVVLKKMHRKLGFYLKFIPLTFDSLNLIEPILRALQTEGYTNPTPIQQQSIPVVLEGRDLLGCAQTGTGKTAAFAIPVLQLLFQQKNNTHTKHTHAGPARCCSSGFDPQNDDRIERKFR